MKKLVAILGVVLLLGCSFFIPTVESYADGWVIDGDKVYFEDDRVYLSASPHTIGSSGWVEFELLSKVYEGDIDVIWGFASDFAKPTRPQVWRKSIHYNESYYLEEVEETQTLTNIVNYTNLGIGNYSLHDVYLGNENNTYLFWVVWETVLGAEREWVVAFNEYDISDGNVTITYNHIREREKVTAESFLDWMDLSLDPTVIHRPFKGMDTWYLLKNVPITSNKLYKLRAWLDVPFTGLNRTGGKYWWAVKPSSLTLDQAIATNTLYYLDPWWNVAWNNYVTCTIESDFIATPLLNFPVLVKVDATTSLQCDGGNSVRFIDEDNVTEYYHEIEGLWNATGENYCWVNITSIPASSDYTFLMYYDNAGASSTSDPSNTFSYGYDLVAHMNNGTIVVDSAGLSPGGFENSTVTAGTPYADDGWIGNGTFFDSGSNEFFSLGDHLDLGYGDYTPSNVYATPPAFTLTYWLEQPTHSSQTGTYCKYGDAPVEQGFRYYMWESSNRDLYTYLKTPYTNINDDLAANQEKEWNYYTYHHDGTQTQHISINRSTYVVTGAANLITNMSCYGYVGATYDGSVIGRDNYGTKYLYGTLDELRLSIGVNRNDSWLDAEYNCTADYANFLSIGAEQDPPPAAREWRGVNLSFWFTFDNTSGWLGINFSVWFDFANTSFYTGEGGFWFTFGNESIATTITYITSTQKEDNYIYLPMSFIVIMIIVGAFIWTRRKEKDDET